MTPHWYYSHAGLTHGPFSMEQIKQHAAKKLVLESDLLWQGGFEKDAVMAQAALDFFHLPVPASPPLDWLEDVAQLERIGPLPGPLPCKENPEWLDDLRLWYGLELFAGAAISPKPANMSQTGRIPDWMEGWITAPTPKISNKAEVPVSAAKLPEKPAAQKVPPHPKPIKTFKAVPLAAPVSPPKPAVASLSTQSPPALESKVKPTPPLAIPVIQTSPANAEALLVARAIQEIGIDLKTGQVLNPDKFRTWQKSAHAQQPAVTNKSLFEVFRKARTAIENWVDEESCRQLILSGDLEKIKKDVQLMAIFSQFQGYGSPMQEKLANHLEFMVENRRKYYAACS